MGTLSLVSRIPWFPPSLSCFHGDGASRAPDGESQGLMSPWQRPRPLPTTAASPSAPDKDSRTFLRAADSHWRDSRCTPQPPPVFVRAERMLQSFLGGGVLFFLFESMPGGGGGVKVSLQAEDDIKGWCEAKKEGPTDTCCCNVESRVPS